DSGTTRTSLKPDCSSDWRIFCCVSGVRVEPFDVLVVVDVPAGLGLGLVEVCAKAGAASRMTDAIIGKAGTRILMLLWIDGGFDCRLLTSVAHNAPAYTWRVAL